MYTLSSPVQRSTPAQPHPLPSGYAVFVTLIVSSADFGTGFRKNMCNNTAFLCMNLSQEQCDLAAMADGIIDLIIPVISTSLLLGLFLGLRREAWNTPLKRLSLLLCTFYGLNGLIVASVELYNELLPEVWCKVFFFAKG